MSLEMEILEYLDTMARNARKNREEALKDIRSVSQYEAGFLAARESGYEQLLIDLRDIIDTHAHEEYAR